MKTRRRDASAGATLDNRTGAAALPSSALLLADVLVAAADTSITDAEIRDYRAYASTGALVGEMKAYGGATAPAGWKLCDGAALKRGVFAALFAVLGTAYGAGDGSTTFLLPNAKGRVLVGLDAAQGEFDVLGDSAGGKTHTLTTPEIPAHTHAISPTAAQISISADSAGGAERYAANGATATQSTGGGGAHNNLQPYLTINYMIFTGSAA